MDLVLFHIDGFGGTILNTTVNYFSNFGNLYTFKSLSIFLVFSLLFLISFIFIKVISGDLSTEKIFEKLIFDKNNITNNIFIKSFIFFAIYTILLTPVPLIQLTPVVKIDSVSKSITLLGYTVNDKKTIIGEDGKVAFLPAVVAVPLSIIEKYFYSIPDLENDGPLIKANDDTNFGYTLTVIGSFNDAYAHKISNCNLDTLNTNFTGYLEGSDIEGSNCYLPLPEYGALAANPDLSGTMFNDYFSPIVKVKDILNSNVSFLVNAYFKMSQKKLKDATVNSLVKLPVDNASIAKYNEITDSVFNVIFKEKLNIILNKISENANLITLIKDKLDTKNYIKGLTKAYIGNLVFDEPKDFIFLDNTINYTDSTEVSNFLVKRNDNYAAIGNDNLKRMSGYQNKIDEIINVENDNILLYNGANINFNFSFNNNKPVLNIENINSVRVPLDNSALASSVKATALTNIKVLFENLNINSSFEFLNKTKISEILNKANVPSSEIEEIKKRIDLLASVSKKYSYIYLLDLLQDLTDKRTEELNFFINNFLSKYKKDISENKFNEVVLSEDEKDAIIIKIRNDILDSSVPVFGYLLDGYSTVIKNKDDTFSVDLAAGPRLLYKPDPDDDFYSKYIDNDGSIKFTNVLVNKDFIDIYNLNTLLSNSSLSQTFNENQNTELRKNLELFHSAKPYIYAIKQERKLKTFNKDIQASHVFCPTKYTDSSKQEEFCKAVNLKIDNIKISDNESPSLTFKLNDAIGFVNLQNLYDFINLDSSDPFDIYFKNLYNFKIFLSGTLIMVEQSEYSNFLYYYNILRYGQNILEVDNSKLTLNPDLITKLENQYAEDSNDDNLKNLMKISYINAVSFYNKTPSSNEVNNYVSNNLDKIKDFKDLVNENEPLEVQLSAISSYVAYKTLKVDGVDLPSYLLKNGLNDNIASYILNGESGSSDLFNPEFFNLSYSFINSFLLDPIRGMQNVLVTKEKGQTFLQNQILDTSLLVGPQVILNIDNTNKKDSSFSISKMDWQYGVSLVVQFIAIVAVITLSIYFLLIILMAIIMNTLGLFYSLSYLSFAFLLKSLFSSLEEEDQPEFLRKSYYDIALIGIKYLSSWVIFFAFVYVLLLIYNNIILNIQNAMELKSFVYMIDNGVSSSSLFFMYGAVIILPFLIYLGIIHFLTKQTFKFFRENTISDPKEIISKMKKQSINALKVLRNR